MKKLILPVIIFYLSISCSDKDASNEESKVAFQLTAVKLDGTSISETARGISLLPTISIESEIPLSELNLSQKVTLSDQNNGSIAIDFSLSEDGKTVRATPRNELSPLSTYRILIRSTLSSTDGNPLNRDYNYAFNTQFDENDKFERIAKDELLTLVQQQTFKYFWDFAHSSSGMIRERNTSNETVTTGGTGFGLMAIVVGIHRGFITENEGKQRVRLIVDFLNKANRYHGAFSHWYNGATGETQPFSENDNGADLVETSLLFQGLIAAMEYFNDTQLTTDITKLYEEVEWTFFQNSQNILFWHWSPTYEWNINLGIQGWNESLIAYVLAAASPTYRINSAIYDQGWARNGSIKNGRSFYGITLPLGNDYGGPLFLSQYSFLGINPNGLSDEYGNYELQTTNHTLINREHAIVNPNKFYGYSSDCWGFTASDDIDGYSVHSPTHDNSVISPTAAISSMPFTPDESFAALEFFYYKLGDKTFGEYGFKDAFSLHELWFADSYIAIDQGPIIVGIENYRSGLLWNLFMKNTMIKNGLRKLGFNSPNI